MALAELTVQLIAFRVLALLIIAGVHGAIIAGTAVLLGDKGPGYDGRLTIFPVSHVDVFGSIALVFFGLGWAKPVAVDAGQFRVGRVGIVVVILAGFIGLLLTAALLDALVRPALTTLPHDAALSAAAFLRAASSLSIWFALLSLVPIPPLAGGMLLDAFGLRVSRMVRQILAVLLFGAIALGVVRQVLEPAQAVLARLILGG